MTWTQAASPVFSIMFMCLGFQDWLVVHMTTEEEDLEGFELKVGEDVVAYEEEKQKRLAPQTKKHQQKICCRYWILIGCLIGVFATVSMIVNITHRDLVVPDWVANNEVLSPVRKNEAGIGISMLDKK